MIVIDASVVGPLFLPDESEAIPRERATAILDAALIVPAHWHLEVASILQNAVRRKRIGAAAALQSLSADDFIDPEVDQLTQRRAWSVTLPLAERHGLTVYDAAYLELAMRRGASLASLDRDLVKAAQAEGLTLVTLV